MPPKPRMVGFRRAWDPQWQKEQRNMELTWGEDAWAEPGGLMTLLANLGVLLIVMSPIFHSSCEGKLGIALE